MSEGAEETHARERATSPLWFEDQAAGWMVPRDLLK